MEELEKKIVAALTTQLPGIDVRFDPYPGYGKLHTTLIWDEFEDHSFMDRHNQVRNVLNSALTDEERYNTGFFVTVTPIEFSGMQEAAFMAEAMDGIKVAASLTSRH